MGKGTEKLSQRPSSFLPSWPGKVVRFYIDGFKSMTVGRKLWMLILIKLFILFFVFKLFFFPDILQRDYDNDAERAEAVRSSLINR
ncbi:DUF4492 domain-containing protein [uncultured Duncaniella sp.]|uniref:DUF4492 domain-containing protein n=1 Tax=uncultured Duncaniella sp. TaxID=2768039 RepID=UPI002610010A|nr:DUF4492 domain-containing protein [uncultured Duncaniella sp.]